MEKRVQTKEQLWPSSASHTWWFCNTEQYILTSFLPTKPGWSLPWKPESGSQFMALYPKRILYSLYFVLWIPSSGDHAGFLCDWHWKRGTRKQRTMQILVWAAQKLWKRIQSLLSGYECGAVNLDVVHRNQEFSFFLSCERAPTYRGWNLAVEYCQERLYLGKSGISFQSNPVAKLLVGKELGVGLYSWE